MTVAEVMTYAEAVVSVAVDILADPEWTARVVIAALVAQDHTARDSEAWAVLDGALRHAAHRTG